MYAFVKLGCSTNYDGFEANLKIVVQINLQSGTQDIWSISSCKLQGLMERKMEDFIANEKYNHQNTL